ncbi:MAG: flagellar M-ring protein FliF C-terminal domain-containing protein, partial [Rhodanobacter sp.]
YELDRTISHVSDPAGRLARLTVAVVLDNKVAEKVAATAGGAGAAASADGVPFSAQELQRLTELTKNAVGFDAARGDSVSVVNQAFHRPPAIDALPKPALWDRPGAMDLIKQGIGVLIALLIAFGLLRPLLKGVTRGDGAARALPAPMPKISVTVSDVPSANEPVRLPDATPSIEYEQRIGQAKRMVGENSKQVAQVVKNWVGEDGN